MVASNYWQYFETTVFELLPAMLFLPLYSKYSRLLTQFVLLVGLDVCCLQAAEDSRSHSGSSPGARKGSLIRQLLCIKLGGESNPSTPYPLARTREGSESPPPQSSSNLPTIGTVSAVESPAIHPFRFGSPPPVSHYAKHKSNSMTELPSVTISTPCQKSGSMIEGRPRSVRELKQCDKIRDLTPARRASVLQTGSPRIMSILQILIPSANGQEQPPINISEICSQINREFITMGELPENLNPYFHMFRFYFSILNEMDKKDRKDASERKKITDATPACLESWLNAMFEENKTNLTCEMILDQFWRMTISEVLKDHMTVMDKETLLLIAQSLRFIADNHRNYAEQRVFFEKAAQIYIHLASRNRPQDDTLWHTAAEVYYKAGKISQVSTWNIATLESLIKLGDAMPNQMNYLIAAHCYLALLHQESCIESKNRYYLLATQSFYKAEAYWECFDLMCEPNAQDEYPFVKERYRDVQQRVFNIQKNKWELSYLVTSILQFILTHRDRSDLPPYIVRWISTKPQENKLFHWYQVIKSKSDAWLYDKKERLFIFSSGHRPGILNCSEVQFDEWLEKLFEVDRPLLPS